MKTLLVVTVATFVAALAWGAIVGGQPESARAVTRAVEVGPDWYAALPSDPVAATERYLQRVPADARARGDAFMATRYATLLARVSVLVASIALIMFSGAAARMRDLARRAVHRLWLQDALFALFLFVVLFLLSLPVETYAGYVRLRQAGLSQRTFLDWFGEQALSWAVDSVFYVLGVVVIMALIRRRPRSWAGLATLVYLALASVYLLISPQYIEPLFNKITPMADGPQKQAILSLARANGVPADNVYIRDASRQGKLLNAHVSGIGGSAQIVLDDNTIATTPKPEFELVS